MQSLKQFYEALPEGGLYGEEELPFLLSPEPFKLDESMVQRLEKLGDLLLKFQLACDRIYKRSKKGRITPWISDLLDAGKPQWLVEAQYTGLYKNALPRVIRPDLLLTEKGFKITELDSVPGGIGISGWLEKQYASSFSLLGEGMISGFRSILPGGGSISISEESASYRSEMRWLVSELNQAEALWKVVSAEEGVKAGACYRFFELFDWKNIPQVEEYLRTEITPPLKPHLEEKLWLALFHTPSLKAVWEEELRGKQIQRLQQSIPYGWVVDPTPLPSYASIPRLEVHDWREVGAFSQKQRQLVLKVSGFSEFAWGSRGVTIGHDTSSENWKKALDHALQGSMESPYILQEFTESKVVEHSYFDPINGDVKVMKGRVRLCPYYFVDADYKSTSLGGVLVTISPQDKKKIHGMRDAILTLAQ